MEHYTGAGRKMTTNANSSNNSKGNAWLLNNFSPLLPALSPMHKSIILCYRLVALFLSPFSFSVPVQLFSSSHPTTQLSKAKTEFTADPEGFLSYKSGLLYHVVSVTSFVNNNACYSLTQGLSVVQQHIWRSVVRCQVFERLAVL